MDSFQLYKDMNARTNGEIYIGVVGPVRTGKSTFIKRFMDLLVLPNMTDEHARERTKMCIRDRNWCVWRQRSQMHRAT